MQSSTETETEKAAGTTTNNSTTTTTNNLVYRCPWKAMKVSNKFGDVTTMFQVRTSQQLDHELLVISSLHDSPFFPKLISMKKTEKDGGAILELERVVPFITVAKYYPNMFEPENEDHLSLIMSNIMVDLIGALITMHGKGIRYGQIKKESFGWNTTKQIWQLFDFRDSKFDSPESDQARDYYHLYEAVNRCLSYTNYEVFRKYPDPLDAFERPFYRTNPKLDNEKIKQIYFDAFVAYAESAIAYGRLDPAVDRSIMASRRLFYENDLFK